MSTTTATVIPRDGHGGDNKVGVAPVSVLSLNCYLIPAFYLKYLAMSGAELGPYVESCKDQDVRAQRIAKELVHKHDISALQEVWGGEAATLQKTIDEKSDEYEAVQPAWKVGSGLVGDVINTAIIMKWRQNGGLYNVFNKSVVKTLWFHHLKFENCTIEAQMNKSVTFQLLDVSSKWGPGKKLVLINTHLHSPSPFGHTEERKAQRGEIIQVLKAMLPGGAIYASNAEVASIVWQNTGVLLVGDFNTAYETQGDKPTPTPEYLETLATFDARDLYLDNPKPGDGHAVTYDANNSLVAKFTVDDAARMDYVLAVDSLPSDAGKVKVMALQAMRCEIVMPGHGNEHSDHYAYSFEVVPKLD